MEVEGKKKSGGIYTYQTVKREVQVWVTAGRRCDGMTDGDVMVVGDCREGSDGVGGGRSVSVCLSVCLSACHLPLSHFFPPAPFYASGSLGKLPSITKFRITLFTP